MADDKANVVFFSGQNVFWVEQSLRRKSDSAVSFDPKNHFSDRLLECGTGLVLVQTRERKKEKRKKKSTEKENIRTELKKDKNIKRKTV